MAAAVALGVLVGTRLASASVWMPAAVSLAAVCGAAGRVARLRAGSGNGPAAGLLVLGTLVATGAAVASLRVVAVRGGLLVGRVERPGVVELTGTVAEEPRRVRFGGYWVVLTVDRVEVDGRRRRTRERTGTVLSAHQAGGPRPAVGDRVWLRAGVGRARWGDGRRWCSDIHW